MMSIPSLVRIAGNELDGLEARQAILGELGDHVILHVKVGRFAHAKIPSVSSKPWFADWKKERNVVTTILRIISVHCGVNRHMKRFESVEDGICVCLERP
jgi:hypothetical protein